MGVDSFGFHSSGMLSFSRVRVSILSALKMKINAQAEEMNQWTCTLLEEFVMHPSSTLFLNFEFEGLMFLYFLVGANLLLVLRELTVFSVLLSLSCPLHPALCRIWSTLSRHLRPIRRLLCRVRQRLMFPALRLFFRCTHPLFPHVSSSPNKLRTWKNCEITNWQIDRFPARRPEYGENYIRQKRVSRSCATIHPLQNSS